MDENASKALQIAAATLLVIVSVTAAIIYLNLARTTVGLGRKKDLSVSREELYFEELERMRSYHFGQISGTEARNIIFEFSGDQENIVVDYMENGSMVKTKINQIRDKLTGQQDVLRINNLIQPSDKLEIKELKLYEDNTIYVRINKIAKHVVVT